MITGNEPISVTHFRDGEVNGEGLSILQHFAGLAMQGMLSNRELQLAIYKDCKIDGTTHENALAFHAVKEAKLLIAELNKY